MYYFNKIILLGYIDSNSNLTINVTADKQQFIEFNLAISKVYKDKNSGERIEQIEYFNIAVFNPELIKLVENNFEESKVLLIKGCLVKNKDTIQIVVEDNNIHKITIYNNAEELCLETILIEERL